MPRKTRVLQTLQTLTDRGHISVGSAIAEHGRYHVGQTILQLRTTHQHLLPAGHEVVTIMKEDSNGTRYAEWRLRAASQPVAA